MIVTALTATSRAALLALALIALAAPAQAQQPSANAIAMAKEIIVAKGSAEMFNNIIPSLVDRSKTLLLQTNPLLGRDLNDVATKLRTELAPRTAELMNEMAKVYAGSFTEAELRDALAFYKSPLGKKIITVEPEVLDRTIEASNAWSEKFAEEVIGKIRTEMKKKGHDL
jgi:uncharacterized protein